MNDYRKLAQLAKQYKALYPKGTRVELLMMGSDPRPIEPGTRGTVDCVDDMGTIHCTFDNGRRLGIIPEEDSFRKLTEMEVLDERSAQLQKAYIDKINTEVIPCIEWIGMKNAYRIGDMAVPTDLLRMLHEKYVEVYGSDPIGSSAGMVTVPGLVEAADGNVYPALLDLDADSSGEHWGTTFFMPQGVLSDHGGDDKASQIIRTLIPYRYWYTPVMERDHHVDWESCPERVTVMLNEATGQGYEHVMNMQCN